MSEFYVAVIETNREGEFFVTVPDLPGVNAAAVTRHEALELAVEFANDYVRDLTEEGHAVPPARDLDKIERDPEVREVGRALIPVEVPGRSLKISLSIDQALLTRADRRGKGRSDPFGLLRGRRRGKDSRICSERPRARTVTYRFRFREGGVRSAWLRLSGRFRSRKARPSKQRRSYSGRAKSEGRLGYCQRPGGREPCSTAWP